MPVYKDVKGNRWRVQEATCLEGYLYYHSAKHSKVEWTFNVRESDNETTSYQIIHDSLKVKIANGASFYFCSEGQYLDHSDKLLAFEVNGSVTHGTSGIPRLVSDAKGKEGYLFYNTGNMYFRVYASNYEGDFTDYAIYHHDLLIIILGPVALYHSGNKQFLDYPPRVLGYKLVGEP